MKKVRHYSNYEDYINFQSEKTSDPEKRKKWLGEEWDLKLEGFKSEFRKFGDTVKNIDRALCIGARTGQEVVALRDLGANEVVGIDIVPHSPHVLEGDMHNLQFEDETFDFVYANVLNYSIDHAKMISEIERVLKAGGIFFLQVQCENEVGKYSEIIIDNPVYDILTLTNTLFCSICQPVQRNFAGMNFEFVFKKSKELTSLYRKYGSYSEIDVPEEYLALWNDINLEIQNKKLDTANIISNKARKKILSGLRKRGYYLTRVAESFSKNRICEVGTAEGWQFYTFSKYVSDLGAEGSVTTCDPRDVRNKKYKDLYESDERFNYIS